MTHHVLETPVTEAQVRALKVGDTVTLEKTLFGVRDANLIAMFDRGRRTVFDMQGHAVIHTAPNVRKVPVTNECPTGYEAVCVGTTTSQRMERFTRPLMEREGVRIIIGKGGMGLKTLAACKESGAVYLHAIGGAAQFYARAIKKVDDVSLLEFGTPEAMWHLQVEDFPAIVTMDDHGNSLHKDVEAASGTALDGLASGRVVAEAD